MDGTSHANYLIKNQNFLIKNQNFLIKCLQHPNQLPELQIMNQCNTGKQTIKALYPMKHLESSITTYRETYHSDQG